MSEANTNLSDERNQNAIIIVAAMVLLAIILVYFRDRQQKRAFELQQLDSKMDIWEEWGPAWQQQQNRGGGRQDPLGAAGRARAGSFRSPREGIGTGRIL
jgi:hypothetical protein